MRKLVILWFVGWALFGFPWTSFTPQAQVSRIGLVPFGRARRRDQILNFVYYLPFGALGILLGWPVTVVTGVAALLSGATEFVQVFSTDRFPSATDLLLNIAGAVVGCGVVVLLRRRRHVT